MATVAGSLRNKVLVLDDVTTGDLTVTGSVTISGTATTLNSTNTSINDSLIELNAGLTGSNPNDLGLILERGSTGNNVFIGWDESADKVVAGLTTSDGTATGNLSLTYANFQAANSTFTGNVDMASGHASGKFAVKSSGVHNSFDFYNNGTSYFNGQTEVNAEFRISSSASYITHFNYQDGGNNIISQANSGSTTIRNNNGTMFTLSSAGNLAITGSITSGGNTVWHAGNDGTGSTLDADLLDGQHGSYYRNASNINAGTLASARLPGHMDVGGQIDFGVSSNYGTTTSADRLWISSHTTGQSDVPGSYHDIINLSSSALHGIQIASGYGANSGSLYMRTRSDNTNAPAGQGLQAWNKLWHSNNDGSGSGLDADTVDGLNSGSFLRSDAGDTHTGGTITLGSGSSIDASTNDRYLSFRVIRNAGSANTDGMYIGYGNSGSGHTRLFGGGATSGGLYIRGSGANDITYGNNTGIIWHAANDGSGSGLDADLLDGKQGADLFNFGYAYSSNNISRAVGSGAQWYKVASFSGGVKHITMKVHSSGDNTTGADSFFIAAGSYGMKAHIIRMPSSKYNGTKLEEVRTKWVSGASYEIWIKVASITSSTGYLQVFMNDSGVTSSLSAGTEPTVGSADNTLPITATDRVNYSLQATGKIEAITGFDVNGNTVWHAGNDGSGSGLDADTVDGIQASSFLRSDATDTASGTITFSNGINVGDLSNGGITGNNYNITGVNALTINDPGEGIIFGGGSTTVTLYAIDDSTDSIMNFSNASELRVNNSKVWHAGNDGSASGLDADTLDGQHASAFLTSGTTNLSNYLRKNAADTASGNLTFTGNINQTNGSFISNGSQVSNLTTAWQAAGTSKSRGLLPFRFQNGATGQPESGDNAHWGLNIYAHAGSSGNYPYGTQLSAGSTQQLWHRWWANGSAQSWRKIWDSANDGSGSGLDADTVDGIHGASFLRSDAADSWNSLLTYTGSANGLEVGGIRGTALGSQTGDFIHLYERVNIGYPNGWGGQAAPSYGLSTHGGAQFNVGNVSNAPFTFNGNTVWHAGNDGSGSGLDADLIDGIDSSRIVYGSNSRKTNNSNPNTALNSGFYDIYQTNAPTATWYSYITMAHTNTANQHGHQIAGSFYSDGDIFNRHYDGTTASFGNWTRIWNAANDGSGSGLDADTLDGINSSSFMRSDANDTTSGNITISKALPKLILDSPGSGDAFSSQGAQISLGESGDGGSASLHLTYRGDGFGYIGMGTLPSSGIPPYSAIRFKYNSNHIQFNSVPNVNGNDVWYSGNDGSGSGLDADLLDGQQGSYYARKTYWPDATTQLGASVHSLTNLNTTALWSQPAGYQTMVRASNSNGLPSSHGQSYFGYQITSKRDTAGGYSALLTAYDNSNMWFTYQTTSTAYPTWRKLWHDGNDGSGSGLDADTVDGIQGASLLRSDASDTASGQITFTSSAQYPIIINASNNGKMVLRGSSSPYIRFQNGTTDQAFIQSTSSGLELKNQADSSSIRIKDSVDFSQNGTTYHSMWHAGNDGSGSGLDADTLDGEHKTKFMTVNTGTKSSGDFNNFTDSGNFIISNHANISNSPPNSYAFGLLRVTQISGTSIVFQEYITHSSGEGTFIRVYWNPHGWTSWRESVTFSSDGSGSGLDADTLDGTQRSSFLYNQGSGDFRNNPGGSNANLYLGHTPTTNVGSAFINVIKQTAQYAPGVIRFYISPTGTTNSTSNTYKMFEFQHDGDFHADGDVTAFSATTGSDRKLKKNIRDLEGSLDKTLKLRGVKFDWKEEKRPNDQLGFIAQEVQEVLPEVVKEVETLTKEDETHLTVNYPAVVPLLVEAIKEQQSIINRLEERLSDLESKLK